MGNSTPVNKVMLNGNWHLDQDASVRNMFLVYVGDVNEIIARKIVKKCLEVKVWHLRIL